MALTAKQRQRRKQSLGGSDIAVILGFDERTTQYDLWLEKTKEVEEWDGNDATEVGNVVEPVLIDYAKRSLELDRVRQSVFRAHATLPFHANLDAMVVGTREAIEAKSSAWQVDEEWGEPGTDDVPDRVVVQCQWQMMVADLDVVHVVGLLVGRFGGMKLRLYRVERNEELVAKLAKIGMDWWDKHVIQGEEPDDLPTERMIKRLVRVPNKTVRLDADLVRAYELARIEKNAAEKVFKRVRSELHAQLGDAERGVCEGVEVTFFEHNRKGYEVKPTTFRRLHVKEIEEVEGGE